MTKITEGTYRIIVYFSNKNGIGTDVCGDAPTLTQARRTLRQLIKDVIAEGGKVQNAYISKDIESYEND